MSAEDIKILKEEVDAIQIQLMKAKTPWYKAPSTLIATLAFLFSLASTGLSFYINHLAEIRDNRGEARQLLQRLSKLPIENYTLLKTYQSESDVKGLTSLIAQENAILAQQAAEMIERYPDSFKAVEFLSVAYALRVDNNLEKAERFCRMGLERVETVGEYLCACRELASLRYLRGDSEGGRGMIKKALGAWQSYTKENLRFMLSSDIQTLFACIDGEMALNERRQALQRVLQIEKLFADYPQFALQQTFGEQVMDRKKRITYQ